MEMEGKIILKTQNGVHKQNMKKEIHRIQRYIQYKKRQNVNDRAIPKIQRKRKVQERECKNYKEVYRAETQA